MNKFFYFLSEVSGKTLSFISVPLLSNALGSENFGRYTLAYAVMQFLILSCHLSGPSLLVVSAAHRGDFILTRLFLANMNLSTLCLVFTFPLLLMIPSLDVFNVKELFVILLGSFGMIFLLLYQALERGRFNFSQLIKTNLSFHILTFIILYFSLFYSENSTNRIFIIGLLSSIIAIYGFRGRCKASHLTKRNKRYSLYGRISRVSYLHVTYRAIRLLPHQFSSWAKGNLDKFFLVLVLSPVDFGVFSLAVTISSLIVAVFALISQTLQPYILLYLKSNASRELILIVLGYCFLVFMITAFVLLVPESSFVFIFGADFVSLKKYLDIRIFGSMCGALYFIFSHVLLFYNKLWIISLISFSSTLLLVLGLFMAQFFNAALESYLYTSVVSSALTCLVSCAFSIWVYFDER